MPHRVAVVAAAVIALAGGARGAEKARWAVVERSYPPITIDAAERHGPPDEPPAAPDSPPVKVTNVVLSNEHLSIEVAVEAAGRIMHATCARDGVEVFHVLEKLAGGRTWDGGGWRSSFPFQEHGMRYTDQPAGWRVAEGDDGSVTLAMDMRFGRFQAPEELGRYGRFTHLRLGRSITLRPGQACVEITSTVENPLPYRYGYRLWSTAQFPHEPDAEFLLAVTRVSDHGLRGLTDWRWGEGRALHRNWDTYMSVFSVNVTQPFAGVYYPARDLNRLRIADPARLPGGKLYAWSHPSFFYELWTGSEHLFEQEGRFVEPFGRQSYTERYYVARGIGRVDYANEHFAVSSQRDGNRIQVRLLPAHDVGEATAEGSVAGGAEMALSAPDGRQLTALRRPLRALAPWTLECRGDASDMPVRVRVTTGGAAGREPEVLLDVRLPLVLPPADPTLEADLRQKIRPERTDLRRLAESYEKRAWLGSRSPNLPSAALRAALDWAQARPQEAAAHLQVGRVLYMLGRLDKAVEALRLALARDAANLRRTIFWGWRSWSSANRRPPASSSWPPAATEAPPRRRITWPP